MFQVEYANDLDTTTVGSGFYKSQKVSSKLNGMHMIARNGSFGSSSPLLLNVKEERSWTFRIQSTTPVQLGT